MSIRLTNDLRETIALQAVAHAFDPRIAALAKAEEGLAEEAYNHVFPESERKMIAKVPRNWVRFDQNLRFNVAGLTINLTAAGEGFPVPYSINGYRGYSCHKLGTIEAGDLATRIQAHAKALEDLKSERRVALRHMQAMLAKITTLKRLREIWPEGAQFYAKWEAVPAQTLPTIRVDEINAMLGLAA